MLHIWNFNRSAISHYHKGRCNSILVSPIDSSVPGFGSHVNVRNHEPFVETSLKGRKPLD